MFQSLTGSIHTLASRVLAGQIDEFQSLTGSIHTIKLCQAFMFAIVVSIPHRFNSHSFTWTWLEFLRLKFQSLTGSIHTKISEEQGEGDYGVSIPHRFNSHSCVARFDDQEMKSFNPSQVQFTLKEPWAYSMDLVCFNPSQVQFTP